MKKIVVLVIAFGLAAGMVQGDSSPTHGTPFGVISTAQTIGMGQGALGLGVGVADMNSFFGFFAYGMSATTEGRIKVGIADKEKASAETTFGLDFHHQMLDADANRQDPIDLAVGGFMEYMGDVVQVGGDILGSYPITLNNNTTLTPYGRFNVRLERFKSDSELKFGLSLGAGWDMTRDLGLFCEFQLDGNDGVFLALRYRVL